MNPFKRQTFYFRHPNGGVENIAGMYAAGFRTFLLAVHDPIETSDGKLHPRYTWTAWQTIINRINTFSDAIWLPWGYIWNDSDLPLLRQSAQVAYAAQTQKLSKPAACFNVEKQLDNHPISGNPGGATVHMPAVVQEGEGMDVLFSTQPIPFSGVNYTIVPKSWIVDVQLFPQENATSKDPRGCRAKWFVDANWPGEVNFMNGIHDGMTYKDFAWPDPGRFSIYTADDAGNNFLPWRSRPNKPLSKTKYPYRGPFYASTSKNYPGKPMKDPSIKWIKKALHNAGYGNFADSPDPYWNKLAEQALVRMQQEKGLPETGNFGRGAYAAILSLASSNPGWSHAIRG